nr:ammonia-forming cytochrome c nitrite reductase subunit c552 [Solirubrobacteraceae bacterium]
MSPLTETSRRRLIYGGLIAVVAVLTAGVTYLALNISERKADATQTYVDVVELDESTVDPAIWGQNFPRQYDSYLRTVDTERTTYGGSEAFDKLEMDPRLVTIFSGYAFGIDYKEERGHAYMLTDQEETARVTEREQPGACLHCHASVLTAYYDAGVAAGAEPADDEGLLEPGRWAAVYRGFEVVNALPYAEANALVEHPVSCIDCHDPVTMQLRVTRPAFMDGINVLAASDAPVPHLPSIQRWRDAGREGDYDPNVEASRQELRSLACAQCHVEYYFKGEEKLLTYPWHDGLRVEQIETYYDEVGHADWEHAISGAPVLKAQHPEFETWSQGIHGRSGVACADCHMPRLPHALHARGRGQGQRPPREEPAAQRRARLPALPPVLGRGAHRARRDDPGAHRGDARRRRGRAGEAHRGDRRRRRGRGERRRARRGTRPAAPLAVARR